MDAQFTISWLLFVSTVGASVLAFVGFAVGFRKWVNALLVNHAVISALALGFYLYGLDHAALSCFCLGLGISFQRVVEFFRR